jgi:hypothetical protein
MQQTVSRIFIFEMVASSDSQLLPDSYTTKNV